MNTTELLTQALSNYTLTPAITVQQPEPGTLTLKQGEREQQFTVTEHGLQTGPAGEPGTLMLSRRDVLRGTPLLTVLNPEAQGENTDDILRQIDNLLPLLTGTSGLDFTVTDLGRDPWDNTYLIQMSGASQTPLLLDTVCTTPDPDTQEADTAPPACRVSRLRWNGHLLALEARFDGEDTVYGLPLDLQHLSLALQGVPFDAPTEPKLDKLRHSPLKPHPQQPAQAPA